MKNAIFSFLTCVVLAGVASGQNLTIWTTLDNQSLEWLRQETASFSGAFGLEVDVVEMALGELRERALLSAPDGKAADLLVGVPHDQFAEMAAGGVLANMSAFATQSYLQDLYPHARLAYTFDGELYGLPIWVEGPALIVNTDLVPEVPDTYEELIRLAQDLSTADTFGFMFDINNFYYSYTWLHSYGGYIFGRDADGDPDAGDIGLASEGAIRGAEELQSLRHEYGLVPPGTDYGVSNRLFADGVLAMTYDGPWAISSFRNAGVSVTVLPLPPREEDGAGWAGFMGVQGVLMNAFSGQKVDAVNLAKWLVRPAAQAEMARLSGRIPASVSAVSLVNDYPDVVGFAAALQNAEPMANIPEMGRVWQPMGRALSAITRSPNTDVRNALEKAVQEIAEE